MRRGVPAPTRRVRPLCDRAGARRAVRDAELERVVGLGYKSATIPTTPPVGVPYNSPDYDPLWKVAVDACIPLSLHTGTGALPQFERGPGGAIINYAKVGLLSAETLCYFAASGVLERFPGFHLVFVETGAGWLAYCCERMDEAFEEHSNYVKPKLAAPPSHYAKTQCHVTLGADRAPLLAREVTGIAPLLWASDYPHPEGTFPESQAVVARIFADLPEDERREGRRAPTRRALYRRRPEQGPRGGISTGNTLQDKTAIVGVGSTPYYRRGRSVPQTSMELAGKAVLAALDDAGLSADDLDGFALYSMGFDTSLFAQWLGVPDVKFTGHVHRRRRRRGGFGRTGRGRDRVAEWPTAWSVVMTLQQAASRFGASFAPRGTPGATYSAPPSPEGNFIQPSGLMGPGQMFAVLAQRHMHLYGTKREHFAEVAISTREQRDRRRETSLMRDELTLRRLLRGAHDLRSALPLRLLPRVRRRGRGGHHVDRAGADLRHPPAVVTASAHGGARPVGPSDHVDGNARRVLHVVGPPRGRRTGCGTWRASVPRRSTSRSSTTTSRPW